jgi:hypothetical protein
MSSHLFNPTFLLDQLQTRSGETVRSYDAVSAVLTNVYQCSLYKEETRDVRCRIIIVQELPREQDFDLLRLAQPVALSVAALRRLSFATVDPDSVIVVDCRGTEPSVIGFGNATATLSYFYALEIYKRPYEIACLAPGVVELSAHEITVRFARDKYVIPELHQAVSCAVPSVSVTNMVKRVAFPGKYGLMNYSMGRSVGLPDPEKFRLHHAALQAEAPGPARWALSNYVGGLVEEIRRIGAGVY